MRHFTVISNFGENFNYLQLLINLLNEVNKIYKKKTRLTLYNSIYD